jgi:DDE superfamily endonuclease
VGDADTAPQLQKLVFGQYVMVLWADRVMALPFLTLLAPSKRFYTNKNRAPKTLLDWARQAALQIHRWLPDRYVVLVADSAFAAIEFLAAVRNYVCVVTRLRLDANLFDFPPPKHKGRGRKPIKGKPQKKLSAVLKDGKVSWKRYRVSLWYGRTNRRPYCASFNEYYAEGISFHTSSSLHAPLKNSTLDFRSARTKPRRETSERDGRLRLSISASISLTPLEKRALITALIPSIAYPCRHKACRIVQAT